MILAGAQRAAGRLRTAVPFPERHRTAPLVVRFHGVQDKPNDEGKGVATASGVDVGNGNRDDDRHTDADDPADRADWVRLFGS
ncbi:MAG: hypothetical protein AAF581_01815 [Planctomycetota bacterium]